MIRITLTLAALIPLAGCDLGVLEGKPSQFQIYQERLAALEARAPVIERVYVAAPEPVVMEFVEPEPVCVPVFRVKECP